MTTVLQDLLEWIDEQPIGYAGVDPIDIKFKINSLMQKERETHYVIGDSIMTNVEQEFKELFPEHPTNKP